jgi:hypothetical protein
MLDYSFVFSIFPLTSSILAEFGGLTSLVYRQVLMYLGETTKVLLEEYKVAVNSQNMVAVKVISSNLFILPL